MKIILLIPLVVIVLVSLACTGSALEPTPLPTPESTPVPTPDIAATVEAGIAATREAEASAAATIEARVAATLAAPTSEPTPTPEPTPTGAPTTTPSLTSQPTATRQPTATPQPTLTPYPTPTEDEEERLIALLYRCYQIPEFAELVAEEAGFPQELMPLLEDWDTFHAIMSLAVREEPGLLEDLRETEIIFSLMCGSDTTDGVPPSDQSTSLDEEKRLVRAMYDCIQTSQQFREDFLSGIREEGMSAELMGPILEDWDAFLAIMLIGIQEDPSIAESLIPMTSLLEADCDALSTP